MLRAACIALAAVVLCGCGGGKRTPVERVDITLAEVLEMHNARAASLDRLWARASVQVSGRTEGGRLNEQAEGHLQIDQPDRVALSLGKLGKVQLYLGSDASRYWWMDMVDGDAKSVVLGRHDLVTPRKAELLGVPVYPRDLVRLIGITPIERDRVIGELVQEDGRLVLEAGLAAGRMRVYFDPASVEPARVEMYDAGGVLQVASDLERYDFVTVVGDATLKPRVAEKITLTLGDGTVVRMSLYAAENRPLADAAFDLDRLVRGYGIDEIYDLDAPREGGP